MKTTTTDLDRDHATKPPIGTPSYQNQLVDPAPKENKCAPLAEHEQLPVDLIDEACMESFPCSDPPCYTLAHA